ncbi:MAG: hypothetical protein L0Y61_09330 [Epsilonproteobacteria bacterium]|nr:hypothetical protein [Campylobacterota bacterium]
MNIRYKDIFVSYQNQFWKNNDIRIDHKKKEKLNEILFEYISPLTYEGIIVAIADDFAQLCHDIEDLRRLGGFEGVKDFYKFVEANINDVLPEDMHEVNPKFKKYLEEAEKDKDKIIQLERSYVNLILGVYIRFASKMILRLIDIEQHSREKLLINKDLTKLQNLKELQQELNLDLKETKLLEFFDKLIKKYRDSLFCLPVVAKWDMKGKELFLELHNKLYEAFRQNECKKNGINLAILDFDKRDDLKKSYYAGKNFESSLQEDRIEGIPIKFAVWDHLAGMTDNYLIKKYEELTFKRVELR